MENSDNKKDTAKSGSKMLVVAIAAMALLVTGVAVGIYFSNGSTFGFTEVGEPVIESFAVADVRSITTNLSTTNIEVVPHSGDEIRLNFVPISRGNYNRPLFNLNAQGNLEISYESRAFANIVGINASRNNLTIYVPFGLATPFENMSLANTTGNITVETNLYLANNVSMRSTTGRITAANFSATGDITLNSTTGRINLSNLEAGGNISANATTGRIEAENLETGGNLRLSTTTGNVNLFDGLAVGDAQANTTTGRVTTRNFEANSLNVQTTTGRIELEGLKIAGNTTARATTGRIDIDNSQISGILEVRTTTGNINLNNVDTDLNRANLTTTRTSRININ